MESKTFILIHGSWHSAWNWHKVTPLLEKQGHTVHAIDLPGMGRDKTPIQQATLEMGVQRICKLIDSIEGKVILVGHSKNGIMISQAAEYRPDKIERLIYLAAYLIPNGKTQREYSMQDTQGVLKPFVTIHSETNSSTLKPEIFKEGLYHDCHDDITAMAEVILSHEPIVTGATPLEINRRKFWTRAAILYRMHRRSSGDTFHPAENVYRESLSESVSITDQSFTFLQQAERASGNFSKHRYGLEPMNYS